LNGTVATTVDEGVISTTPDANFRWDPSAQQWIFNISTKPLAAGRTYIYANRAERRVNYHVRIRIAEVNNKPEHSRECPGI
jgi:hypothetical protein